MSHSDPHSPNPDTFDAASRALFELGRAFNRMPRRDLTATSAGQTPDLGAILLTQAVADALSSGEPVTVGIVAARLSLDPSTASRLVARGTERGLLHRRTSAADGRVSELSLTDTGERLAAAAARYQRSIFDAATAGWSSSDRATFALLFVDFAASIAAMVAREQS